MKQLFFLLGLFIVGAGGIVSSTTITKTYHLTVRAPGGTCPAPAVGSLTLRATSSRPSGASPLLVFFNATATTDTSITGNTTAFQDLQYTWNFGDGGASGTRTWSYGSRPGVNSRNVATGAVAAHVYVTAGADTTYQATLIVKNRSGVTSSCSMTVTAYDPVGSNGFPGGNTTCASASGTPVAGTGGCPSGAAVINSSSVATLLGSGHLSSGKRVLLKCGDTFNGEGPVLNGIVKASIGAYGGCEGTTSGRPLINDTSGGSQISIGYTSGDIRVADLAFEGNGTGTSAAGVPGGADGVPYRLTFLNLSSHGNRTAYATSQGNQVGFIDSVMVPDASVSGMGLYLNFGGDNPSTWSGLFPTDDYEAIMGNSIDTLGNISSGSGIETIRIGACRFCVIIGNTVKNASNVGAVLKLHNGNASHNPIPWTGVYTEYMEISDNWFTGHSGGQMVEMEPQNSSYDERLRQIIFERNRIDAHTNMGVLLQSSVTNASIRDNVLYTAAGLTNPGFYGIELSSRGIEPTPTGVEVYNNTGYNMVPNGMQFVAVVNNGPGHAANNSYVKNNMFFTTTASGTATVQNIGSGNAVSNNTINDTDNPGMTNGSGVFNTLSDFKPTANYAGGAIVPVFTDALGVTWSPTRDLGAIQH